MEVSLEQCGLIELVGEHRMPGNRIGDHCGVQGRERSGDGILFVGVTH